MSAPRGGATPPWAEVKDGKLVRYIVHADRRIARLHDKTGRPAGALTTLGGDIAPTVDAPLSSSDIVATRDGDVMGLLGWLAALATLGGALFGGALFGARRRQRALAWAAALGPRFAHALGGLLLAASFASLTSCSGTPTSDAPPPIEEGTIRGLTDADTLLFHDQLGTLLTETSGTGEVKARFAAYPYGATRHQSATESRLYANAPRDTGVGLDHMGARFYAPDLGAWTIGDPILLNAPEAVATGEFATANPYAYANLNPVVAVDSDGNFPHVLAGAFAGAGIGFGVEVARQLITTGSVKDWGRVGAAAAGGAVAGAISCAVPGAGLTTVMSVGAGSTVAAGLTERLIVSGGQDAGTLTDVAIDAGVGAVTGGLLKGGSALLKKARPTKPPTAQANQTRVLDSEEAFRAQYAQLRQGGGQRGSTRGANKLQPAPGAQGPHSTFRTDAHGKVTGHAEWKPNPKNPIGFDQVKRVDIVGEPHFNKATRRDVPTPHTHGKDVPGGVRPATPDELPKR